MSMDINSPEAAEWSRLMKMTSEQEHQIVVLRDLLKTCPCPGGGWNGMPDGMEPTVGACVDHNVCGCIYGAPFANQQSGVKT
jgi:hypothetical protein